MVGAFGSCMRGSPVSGTVESARRSVSVGPLSEADVCGRAPPLSHWWRGRLPLLFYSVSKLQSVSVILQSEGRGSS